MGLGGLTISAAALDALRTAVRADLVLGLSGAGSGSGRLRVLHRAGAAAVHLPTEILVPDGSLFARVLDGEVAGRLGDLPLLSGSTTGRSRRLGPTLVVNARPGDGTDLVLVVARHPTARGFGEDDLERVRRFAVSASRSTKSDAVSNGRGPVGALPRDAVFRAALESAAAGMSVVDSDLRYRWVNVALCVMLDRPKEELLSLSAADTVHPEHLGRALAFYERLRRGDFGAVRERFMFHRAIGDPIWADVGGSVLDDSKPLFLVQQFDVTAEQQLTEQLAYRAMHDDLTGLATRALLYDRLDAVLGRSRRAGTRAAVFYLDVDDFKSINDTYGHTVGDIVLSETARRLTTVVRGGDTVARVGGDEFVVAGEVTGAGEAKQMAERLGQVLRPRMNVGGRSLPVSVSIGVALNAPLDGPDEILARADSALLRAKRLPRPDGGPEATAGR